MAGDLDRKLDALSASVDKRFAIVDERFAKVEERFDAVDAALIEQRQSTEFAFDRVSDEMRQGFLGVDGRFNSLERKLDQFIDTQSKTNSLVERRLTALERRSGPE